MNIKNPTFGGFKPDAMSRIAKTLGYEGEMSGFQQYLDQNPDKRTQMDQFKQAAMMMARGGSVQKFQAGGPVMNPLNPNYKPFTQEEIAVNAANNPMAGMDPNQANAFNAQNQAAVNTFNTQGAAPTQTTPATQTATQITGATGNAQQNAMLAQQNANQGGQSGTANYLNNVMSGNYAKPAEGGKPLQSMAVPEKAEQPAVTQPQQQQQEVPDAIKEQQANQERISKAMQEKFGERGNPDNFVPDFTSKSKALTDKMKATQKAFMQSKGIAENDFGAMNRYMQSNPNAQQELEAALQADQQQLDALTQQLQNNPEFKAFQTEAEQYQKSIEEKIKSGDFFDTMPVIIDDGIPPIVRPPEEDIIAPSPEQPKPPSSTKLPQLIQTPQGSFNAQSRTVTLADGSSRQEFTIKDSKGKTVATLTGSAELLDWMKQNEATSYDPSQGMPEPLGEEFITGFTTDQPNWAKTGLTEMFKSGKLPEDPTDFTSESLGNRRHKITYKDGTTLEVGPIKNFDTEPETIRTIIADKINEFKNSPEYTQYKAQIDTYRNYLTGEASSGVTEDIENIEQRYNEINEQYRQAELELQRLQKQAEDNPDDPYLKSLVEEKGEELSNLYDRQQQLTTLYRDQKAIEEAKLPTIEDVMKDRATDPTLPEGAKVDPTKIETSSDQFIGKDVGGLEGDISYDPVKGVVTEAEGVEQPETVTYEADKVTDKAKAELDKVEAARLDEFSEGVIFKGEQGELSDEAFADEALKVATDRIQKVNEKVDLAVTKEQLAEAKGKNLQAIQTKIAKSSAVLDAIAQAHVVQPNELPTPELIAEEDMAQAKAMTDSGLDKDAVPIAAKMASFSVDNGTLAKAAQGDVDSLATVEGQLGKLMKQFDDGTPAWAAGAIRAANAAMASRGLGASSMAGAAILQAAMESALPIAQQDAKTFADMGLRNLDNRQAVAVANAAAQQGLQLQNLDNEQKANLQKSINAFGLQTQNLSNRQAAEVANAQIRATLQGQNLSNMQQSNIAVAARYAEAANINLNNKQQAAMQDNSNSLQISLAELSAEQQAYINSANAAAALQGQVLSNEQQVAISNAARFSEAANLEFTAEQQNTLHNSTLMQTIGLAELNATQAATLQNAAQVANMDITNLNNRQQAAVQNAKAFLQKDMTNLANEQQTALFKAQATQQALLSDQAAENASRQFNAQSENQANQFFANLEQQNNQFNSAQANTMEMANVNAENAALEFAATMKNNREQYESTNELAIAQSNVTWRREVATADTAATNRANELNAINTLDISNQAYDNMWNQYGDQMEWAINSYESEADRVNALTLETMRQEGSEKASKYAADAAASSAIGGAVVSLLTADSSVIGGIF